MMRRGSSTSGSSKDGRPIAKAIAERRSSRSSSDNSEKRKRLFRRGSQSSHSSRSISPVAVKAVPAPKLHAPAHSDSSSDEETIPRKNGIGYEVLKSDMKRKTKKQLLQIVIDARDHHEKLNEQAKEIKQHLDKTYDTVWHVVVLKTGQFASYVSHEPCYSFNFKLGNHIYLIWKTP